MKSFHIASLALVLALSGCSSSQDPKIAELKDRVCKTVSTIGYSFSKEALLSLDKTVREQLLADIEELKVLDPSLMEGLGTITCPNN